MHVFASGFDFWQNLDQDSGISLVIIEKMRIVVVTITTLYEFMWCLEKALGKESAEPSFLLFGLQQVI